MVSLCRAAHDGTRRRGQLGGVEDIVTSLDVLARVEEEIGESLCVGNILFI